MRIKFLNIQRNPLLRIERALSSGFPPDSLLQQTDSDILKLNTESYLCIYVYFSTRCLLNLFDFALSRLRQLISKFQELSNGI